MNTPSKDFGIVILLDALGTRQRLLDDIDKFLADWDLVLTRLKENIDKLEQELSGHRYRIGIRSKDIFDNIQLFYPLDDPHTEYVDLTGSNSIWWSLQHSAELLTNLIRYAITKNIFLRGCISYGHIQEFRNGYYSRAMVENADLAESFDMIGVIAGISAMWVLNNKAYASSPRYRHFVKYRIPIKEPTRNRRKMFDRLAMVNLNRQGEIFENIDDKEIENKILQQIQLHHNNPKVKTRWENTKAFINYVYNISDESLFL
jgi:hypothetical protein